jgi:competence protein ComEC
LYAFITGLAPATVRSAAMFTFVSVGAVFDRKTPMYNTLAASALFILIVNPLLIADIGFQLSYLAVVGIVAIQPGLSSLVPIKHKIAIYFRDLVTVSIAAQLSTLPITLFYFNQFPNYFLLTNLVIIPWSFLVMVVGMAFVVVSPVHGIAFYFGKLLSWLVFGMNWAIKAIESLPNSVSDGINIDLVEMLLISLIIVLLVVFFYSKRKNLLIASILIACILVASTIKGTYYKSRQQAIVLCNYPKINCLLLVNGEQMKIITDSLPTDEKIKSMQQELGIEKLDIEVLNPKTPLSKRFIWFNQQKIVFLDDMLSKFKPHKSYNADIVVIASRKLLSQKVLTTHYPSKLYLIGSGLSAAKTQQWLQRLPTQRYFDVKKTGCFYMKD